jgi:hypothetical protein
MGQKGTKGDERRQKGTKYTKGDEKVIKGKKWGKGNKLEEMEQKGPRGFQRAQ